jgi:hypothetical protein
LQEDCIMTPRLDQLPNDQNIGNAVVPDFGGGAFSQLLMRMGALQLEPNEVRRIESGVFSDLAETCAKCESKKRCEQDVADAAGGMVQRDWESFCPNAATS